MLTSAELNVSFNLDINRFIFTDITDYASQSVAFADIDGVIKVTAPSGEVYSGGSPDIDGATGNRSNITTINVPLLADGTPEVGTYVFTYDVTDGVDSVTVTKTFTYSYSAPTVVLTPTVDCLSPSLTSTDSTNYMSGSTVPTNQFALVYADAATNTLALSGEKMGLLSVGDTFNIINSTANDGNYTVLTIAYDEVNDRTNITVASLTDSTVDGFVSTKTNTIYFPSVLGVSPLVGYTNVVSTNSFYSETHEFKVSTTSYYDFGSGVTVVDTTSNSAELKVDCDVRLCDVYCCIDSVLSSYLNYRGVNDTLSKIYEDRYVLATSHLSALRQAFECGQDAKINTIVQEIFKVTECNPDCSCSDGTPTPITGIGAANITIVQSGDSYINVSSNTVGNTTTYTVTVNDSLLSLITAATATSSVVAGTGVAVTSTKVGDNTEYEVSLTVTPTETKEWIAFDLEIIPQTPGAATFNITNITHQEAISNNIVPGSLSVAYENTTPIINTQAIKIESFQTVANATYKAFIEVVNTTGFSNPFVGTPSSTRYDLGVFSPEARIAVKESGKIEFVLLKSDGVAYTIQEIANSFTNIKLNVKIVE